MKKKLDYRNELVVRANEASVSILAKARTGAVFPLMPTLELLKKAWMAGHEAAKEEKK